MELEIDSTEVISSNNVQVEIPNTIEIEEGKKDYEVSVVKKEYTIIGDSIFIPSMYEDAPPWLKEFINTTIEVAVTNRDQSLIDKMEAILTAMDYVPKNQYTEQINQIVSEDGIINSRIATLNSNLTDAINTTNATIAEINLTYASKDEAAAIATNVLTASLSGSGEIGSTLIELQEAYADLESTTAQSISALESVMEGVINGNTQAMQILRTYIGIDEDGTETGDGLLADMVATSEATTNLSANLSSLDTTVGGHTTQLNTVDTRIGNGMASVEAKWAYNSIVNINGIYRKSGFGLSTNYTTGNGTEANPYDSEFWIDASKFKFTNSNQTGSVAPFSIDASGPNPRITFNGAVSFNNVTNAPTINKTYVQTTQPTWGMITGDTWIDTDDNNTLHTYNGASWIKTQSGAKTYLQTNAPTSGMTTGDIWVDSNDNYKQYRYNGSSWVAIAYDAATAINTNTTTINGGKITTGTLSANKLTSTTGSSTVWTGGGLVSSNFNGNVVGNIGSPTQGFRLSSNAAGSKTDPNIYGAYIKGGILEGSNLWLSTPAGYAKVQHLDSVYHNYSVTPGPLTYDVYSPHIELVSPTYGSGYMPNRVFNLGSSIISVITSGAMNNTSIAVNLTLQYSADGGGWTKLDQFTGTLPGVNVLYYGTCPHFSSTLRIRLHIRFVNYMGYPYTSTATAALTLINQN